MKNNRTVIGVLFAASIILIILVYVFRFNGRSAANGEDVEITETEATVTAEDAGVTMKDAVATVEIEDSEIVADLEPESFLPSVSAQATATPIPDDATPTSVPPTATATSPPATHTPTITPTATRPIIVNPNAIVVDHDDVALFDQIPAAYLEIARNLRMLFSDRSVGQNINEALDCLAAPSWSESPAYCRRDYYDDSWNWRVFGQTDLLNGVVPERLLFPGGPNYNRENWTFVPDAGYWYWLTENFIENIAPSNINTNDVLSYQFSYLNVDEDNILINDPEVGYFADSTKHYDVYDLENFISQHPDKVFIFWTTSLARHIGTQIATDFNNTMRQYALEHGKILFDVADIEAHTDQGLPCYDNRDGIQYCNNGGCENHPDDGINLPAICQDYTTETDGGHLGSVSAGKIQIAKAFWVLMARIAGWDGESTE